MMIIFQNCTIVLREPPPDGRKPGHSGPGYERVNEGNELTITIDDVPRTLPYDVQLRYLTQSRGDWDVAKITVIRPDEYDPEGPCKASHPAYEDRVQFSLPERETSVIALSNVCLEQGKVYKIKLNFEHQRQQEDNPAAQILIDSITLIPRIEATTVFGGSPAGDNLHQLYIEHNCNQTFYDVNYEERSTPECKDWLDTVSIFIFDGANPCKLNFLFFNFKYFNLVLQASEIDLKQILYKKNCFFNFYFIRCLFDFVIVIFEIKIN